MIDSFINMGMSWTSLSLVGGQEALTDWENERQLNRAITSENAAAVDALRRGTFLGGTVRMQGSRTLAQQRVGYEVSGVDSGVGTPLQVADSSRMMSELDASTVRNNAAREALGHRTTASQYQNQITNLKLAGEQRTTGRTLAAVGATAQFLGSVFSSAGENGNK